MGIFSEYALKAVPAGADLILIADSADSNKQKTASLTSILALFTSSVPHNSLSGLNVGDYLHMTAAEYAAYNAHLLDVANPHSVTKSQVNLGNVTNDKQVKAMAGASVSGYVPKWDGAGGDLLAGGFYVEVSGDPFGVAGELADAEAIKNYVDAVATGLVIHTAVRIATTAAGTLASDFENGDTIDTKVLATNDRILIKNQADAKENGIYIVQAAGAPLRAADMAALAAFGGDFVFVTDGSANLKTGWAVSNTGVVTTNNMDWVQFSAAGIYTASNLGGGENVFSSLVGSDFQFKSIVSLSGAIILSSIATELEIDLDSSAITHNSLGGLDAGNYHHLTAAEYAAVVLKTSSNTFSAGTNQIFDGANNTLVIDGTNHKVGVGTVAPVSLLSVIGGLTTVGSVLTLGTNEPSVVVNDILGRINFYAPLEASGGDALLVGASIAAIAENTFTATVNETGIQFSTGASEVAVERMRLDHHGNLGIGITTPVNKIHIDSGTGVASYLQFTANATTGQTSADGFHIGINSSGAANIIQKEALSLSLLTDNTTRIFIDSTGVVGVGGFTSGTYISGVLHSQGAKDAVTLKGSANTNDNGAKTILSLVCSTTPSFSGVEITAIRDTTIHTANHHLTFSTRSSGTIYERMRITDLGSVGIGGISPNSKLHIHESTAATAVYLQISSAVAGGSTALDGLKLGLSTAADAYLVNLETNKALYFGAGGVEFIKILDTGGVQSVGYGVTGTPTSTHEFSGSFGLGTSVYTGAGGTPYNINLGAYTTYINKSSGNNTKTITYTLPQASTCKGRMYIIKQHSSCSTVCRLVSGVGDTVDGNTWIELGYTISVAHHSGIVVVSDGIDNWNIVSEYVA